MARRLKEQLTSMTAAGCTRARCSKLGSACRRDTRYAKQADIDLIVMGTHGRDGISHS